MKLITYNSVKCHSVGGIKKPTIYVHRTGLFSFSGTLSKSLGLKPGTGILFHQDEDDREDWYIQVSDTPEAFRLRATKSKSTCFSSVELMKIFMNSLKLTKKGITLPVSTTPITDEKLYAIITSAAKPH